VPISDHGKGIFVDVAKAVSVKATDDGSGNPANGYISDLEFVAPKDLRDAFSGGTPSVPDDVTISVGAGGAISITAVDSSGNPTAVDAGGNPLDLTPTPAPTVGEDFRVAGIDLTVNDAQPGDSFTLGISDRQSVFGTIENLIDGLEGIAKGSDRGNAEYDALIAESLTNLDNAQEKIILKQTELGGRLNAVESTTAFLEDSGLYTKEIRSQLQDVDYAEAISNLSFQSFVLQAAQQSFAQVSRMSLFDRL